MCAIAGEIALDRGSRVSLDAIPAMISALRHRGPDQWGYWIDAQASVALLNARLAIVDADGGRQPVANEDESIWVTFNGELYGYEALTRELVAKGHRFRTRSDTEILVHLYEEYGDDFTRYLRGEFAFALHDSRQGRTCLVRDRFGIKPLFYTRAGESLIFASEIKGLCAHPAVTPRLDADQIVHMLGGLFMPGASMFEGVQQVPPGCMLRVEHGRTALTRYWRLHLSRDSDARAAGRTDEAVIEEFGHRLEEAVSVRLHGDVESAVYLSGGVDSAVIAHLMRERRSNVRAFTVGFEDVAYDEAPSAKAVADAAGLEHHVERLGVGALSQAFVDTVWHVEQPVVNTHSAAKFVLSALARRHVKVVLTGEGADELLAGYRQFKHQQLLDDVHRSPADADVQRELRAFLSEGGTLDGTIPIARYPHASRVFAQFGAYPYPIAKTHYYQRRLWALLSAPCRRRASDLDSLETLARLIDRDSLAGLPAVAASQQLLFETELPGYILSVLGDRVEMAHAIEGRTPFLDHHLVEFVSGLPVGFKLRGAVDKWLLRQFARSRVPEQALAKKGVFVAPSLLTLGMHRHHDLLDAYLTRHRVEETGIFNPSAVAAVRLGARLLPRQSRARAVCEAATVLALSVQTLFDLYCRDLRGSFARYRWPGTVDTAIGAGASFSCGPPVAVGADGSSSSGTNDSARPSRPATAATTP